MTGKVVDGHTLVQFCEKKDSDIYHYAHDENDEHWYAKTLCNREGELYIVSDLEYPSMQLCKTCEKITHNSQHEEP